MAAKLKIEKRGDEILIVHCCFSIERKISQKNPE
jgi:transcriptional regulatory protein LevR